MPSNISVPVPVRLPAVPATHDAFIEHLVQNSHRSMHDILEPYKQYDSTLREVFAQQPDHAALLDPNYVPVFAGHQGHVKIRARDIANESEHERQCYLMPLDATSRRPDGSPAIVQSLKDFQANFNIFSESALSDLDWSNVVVAGSAALTPLLLLPAKHARSKRALRQYYHENIAPASDVDLFLYGLTEEQAVDKIKQIEQHVRDSILAETTTIRTKNAVTIASQYPIRHIQIVLRIYASISEILTGFDVDCSCVAYDGNQVYASPRALAACITQINTIDLTRRSPSYENRLSKYSHRGFEVYWSLLDRSRIDPTIFERNFNRVVGLARLLVLEKLPTRTARDAYQDQRRAERGRPYINRYLRQTFFLKDNIKESHNDEVADWVDEEDVSDYHTFTIPYGPKYHARNIEKLLYKKDLLLNAEWNKSKDRHVNLHRHPAFFGGVEDIIEDCCGHCLSPVTQEERDVYEQESRRFVSGRISFLKDNPGRQSIGSFNPLTNDDWTDMGYIGNTAVLCNAIVDQDLETVQDWLSQKGADPNRRDHTGRTPLHLAVMISSLDIVQCLIDNGARIVARLADGKTALHIAALRGDVAMVSVLLTKSEANEEEEERRSFSIGSEDTDVNFQSDSDTDLCEEEGTNGDDEADATTEHSYVKVKFEARADDAIPDDKNHDEPDICDVDVLAWDLPVSALHLAIVGGHVDVVRTLVSEFGASPILPVKLVNHCDRSARAAILPLVLALILPLEQAEEMTKTLLSLGASAAQADMDQVSALHYFIVSKPQLFQPLLEADRPMAERALDHVAVSGYTYGQFRAANPLTSAIRLGDKTTVEVLLDAGAKAHAEFKSYSASWKRRFGRECNNPHYIPPSSTQDRFKSEFEQPVLVAVACDLPAIVWTLVQRGADLNTLTPDGYKAISETHGSPRQHGKSLRDLVDEKIESLRNYKVTDDPFLPKKRLAWLPKQGEPPTPLQDDTHYLEDLELGSYAHWAVSIQLVAAKSQFRSAQEAYNRQLKETSALQQGLAAKEVAVRRLVKNFEELSGKLRDMGAKTFKEMHPDAKEPRIYNNVHGFTPHKEVPWTPNLTFHRQDLTSETQSAYRELFEACWRGDVRAIKSLTLMSSNSESKPSPPLEALTIDHMGFSTFQICILRDHFQAARAILEIARAQYAPAHVKVKRRYTLGTRQDSENDESYGDNIDHDIEIHSEIVDDQFTIEDIGQVHLEVKSQSKPLEYIQDACPSFEKIGLLHSLKGLPNAPSRQSDCIDVSSTIPEPSNLFQLAIWMNDKKLFSLLLDLAEDYTKRKLQHDEDEESPCFFTLDAQSFEYVIRSDRVDFLTELVKRTGAGIPLEALVKRSAVGMPAAPKYYQGLSVHGKKREDWAQAERGVRSQLTPDSHPPLLQAARSGSLRCFQWLCSSEAKSCYADFARVNQNDKRLKTLSQSAHGLNGSIHRWLNHHSHLLMHCVILGKDTPQSFQLLRHLVETQPALIRARSLDGQTPLQLAFSLHRKRMAELLISAGADQTCRDKAGRNLMHSGLAARSYIPSIMDMLSLIDPLLISGLCTERASIGPRSLTPVALWYFSCPSKSGHGDVEEYSRCVARTLGAVLSMTKGADLDVMNGAGDTLLHTVASSRRHSLLGVMLDLRPDLLHRENAVGRTPFEIAHDAYLAERLAGPPDIPNFRGYGVNSRGVRDVLQREPNSFITEQEGDAELTKEAPSEVKRTWDLCRTFEVRQKQQGASRERKLVSLQEANEVAKRLASKEASNKKQKTDNDDEASPRDEEEEDMVTDEVQQWCPTALGSIKCPDCGCAH